MLPRFSFLQFSITSAGGAYLPSYHGGIEGADFIESVKSAIV